MPTKRKLPGKNYPYTIIFRDTRTNEVMQGHSNGVTWAEEGVKLLENVTKNDREKERASTTLEDYEVLFAYPGHINTLI